MVPIGVRVFLGCVALAAAAPVSLAEPALTPSRVVVVGQETAGAAFKSGPTEARIDDGARLGVVVIATEKRGKRRRTVYVVDDSIEALVVGGRRIKKSQRRGWDRLDGAEVRWLTIEPKAWKDKDKGEFHSNVSTETETWGKWVGYDKLEYIATEVASFAGGATSRTRPAVVAPSDPEVKGTTKLGTIRYQVQVRFKGPSGKATTLSSPGIEATDRAGILPSVHRVSIRRDDTYLGHLTAFLLVPEIFGSAGSGKNHQTERYVGADCADVLTGAAREAGMRYIKYSNVAGMTRYARTIVSAFELDASGNPATPVGDVELGDIIRINYGGALAGHTPRGWDHVAVLFEDRSDPAGPDKGEPNGELDGFDLVIHMGHPRLVIEPLSEQSPATVDVLRWRKK